MVEQMIEGALSGWKEGYQSYADKCNDTTMQVPMKVKNGSVSIDVIMVKPKGQAAHN